TGSYNFFKTEWRKFLLLLFMGLLYFFSYFQRIAVPGTCFDELQRDFKASAAAITALGSIFLYVYGSTQFFIGMVADRFGGRRTMLFGASVLVCASILFPLSHSLPMLYITRAILAAGASTIFISLAKEIDNLFNPRHFAIWLGVSLFIGYSGGIAGTYPFERAVSHFGWRTAMLGAAALGFIALIATFIVFRKFRVARPQSVPTKTAHLGSVLKNRLTYPVTIAGAINFAIYFLFQAALGKKMLTDCCANSSARAAAITFAMIIVCTSFASLSGFISHLIGNRRKPVILAGVLLTLATTVLLTVALHGRPDYRIIGAGFIMLGISAAISPICLTSIKEVNIGPAAATSMGFANCAAYITVAIITNLAGVVMDCFPEQTRLTSQGIIYPVIAYRLILAGCVGLAVISVIAAFFIRETRGAYSIK
ncbi:MAG: MFS transporter, partial [Kiritimatiellia bacterium]|nr:MFS transporter [Kiritimatiellia bacterium]